MISNTQPQVIFIGGIHGAGKSRLCQQAAHSLNGVVFKQRYLIREIAVQHGFITWEEIGPQHDRFIEDAARLLGDTIHHQNKRLGLVDCHYSIRTAKALRILNDRPATEYIPDLDLKLVSIIKRHFKIKLALVLANPVQAFNRVLSRPEASLDIDNELEMLIKNESLEHMFFRNMINCLQLNQSQHCVIDNREDFQHAYNCLRAFIQE